MSTQEKIIKAFEEANKPLKAGEVAEMAGLEKKEVDKEIKKLTVSGTLHSPKRCFYEIKK
ncbi:MAG: MarR family transcriptional regulator [Bacteroidales bacterium]|nr:MarR family transcriptional regulator [Bacteroidales bacterium]NLM91658.1 MarR family transcriptional regulator [Bacteroidales bacterium]